jgi:hypothetical protein
LERKLRDVSSRLRKLREELVITEEQLSVFADDAHDKGVRALVAETPYTAFEYHDAQRHADALGKSRDQIQAAIKELEVRQDELLDQLAVLSAND